MSKINYRTFFLVGYMIFSNAFASMLCLAVQTEPPKTAEGLSGLYLLLLALIIIFYLKRFRKFPEHSRKGLIRSIIGFVLLIVCFTWKDYLVSEGSDFFLGPIISGLLSAYLLATGLGLLIFGRKDWGMLGRHRFYCPHCNTEITKPPEEGTEGNCPECKRPIKF